MKRAASLLLLLLALLASPSVCFGDIQEVADADGNVTHYKYTDSNGSVVFTDSLAKIPEQYRRRNKIVRIGPPKKSGVAADQKAVAEAPAAPQPPALPLYQVKPDAVPEQQGASGGWLWLILALAIGAGVAGFVVSRRRSDRTPPPPRKQADGAPDRERLGHPANPEREHPRPPTPPEHRGEPERTRPKQRPEEVLNHYLEARDFAAAARLCESLGNLAPAAGYHLQAGNAARARELFLELKDYRRAAELFEQAGDELKAAELFEAASRKESPDAGAASGSESALRSGRLYAKAGAADRAAAVYLKANLFAEAAALFEARQDYSRAAETYLKAGDAEKAAACFEQAGDPRQGYAALSRFHYERGLVQEAARYAEKAGDLMQAATLLQETGELARAGELFFRAGCYAEAAENFALLNDGARAGAAYERAGHFLQAAQAFERAGIERERLATLYEQGGDCYAAGRHFVKLGQLEKALNVLQRVDPASPDYASASLLVGMIFLKRGLTDLAREKFLKLIDNQPVGKSNLEPYYFLALCHERSGDAESARSIFAKILAEDYNFRDVRERAARKESRQGG